MSEEQSPLDIWKEKLNEFQKQEAISSDVAVKFQLKKQIEESKQKIQELEKQEGKILPKATDRQDFTVYRLHNNKQFNLLL